MSVQLDAASIGFSHTANPVLSGHSKIDKNDLNDKCQRNEGDFCNTVKPVLGGHSKIDKSKVLKTNGSLMEVESIAECSLGAFCNTFDLH